MPKSQSALAHEIAEAHWAWLETMLRKVYVDAFVHGYRHGANARRKQQARTPDS